MTTTIHPDFFAGIYTTNSPEAVRYVVEHSRANFVVVEDQEQLDKVILMLTIMMTVMVRKPLKLSISGVGGKR